METKRSARPLSPAPVILVIAIGFYALAAGCGGKTESTSSTSSEPPAAPAAVDTGASAAGGATVAEGAAIYKQRCVLCHGPDGRGDGVGAKGLKPAPRNHHDQAYMKSRTDAQLLEVIHNGKGAMPAWGKVLSDEQINAVLAYVRKLGETP